MKIFSELDTFLANFHEGRGDASHLVLFDFITVREILRRIVDLHEIRPETRRIEVLG